MFYLLTYGLTTLGAFAVLTLVRDGHEIELTVPSSDRVRFLKSPSLH